MVTRYDANMALRSALCFLWPERHIDHAPNGSFTTRCPYPWADYNRPCWHLHRQRQVRCSRVQWELQNLVTHLRSIVRLLLPRELLQFPLVVTVNAVNIAVVVVLVITSWSLRGLISSRIFILRCGQTRMCCRTELWQWLLWYTQSRQR